MALNKSTLELDIKQLASDITSAVAPGGEIDNSIDPVQMNAEGMADAIAKYLEPLVAAYNSHVHIVSTTGTAAAQSGTAAVTTSQV